MIGLQSLPKLIAFFFWQTGPIVNVSKIKKIWPNSNVTDWIDVLLEVQVERLGFHLFFLAS